MPSIRTFLAVPLPEPILHQAQQLQRRLERPLAGMRWVRPENLHLTLKFFGAVPEENLEKIGEIVLSVSSSSPPFQLAVTGVGAFPAPARPRVLWLGLRGIEPLVALHRALEQGLEDIGFPAEERPFSPHLTLGRARQRLPSLDKLVEEYRDRDFGRLPVERLVLFESRLRPGGAVHLARQSFRLRG